MSSADNVDSIGHCSFCVSLYSNTKKRDPHKVYNGRYFRTRKRRRNKRQPHRNSFISDGFLINSKRTYLIRRGLVILCVIGACIGCYVLISTY